MKKYLFIGLFLVSILIISGCDFEEGPEDPQLARQKEVAGGGGGGGTPQPPKDYEYHIEMEPNYDVNSTLDYDNVLLFNAVGRASSNDGFLLGDPQNPVESNRVAVVLGEVFVGRTYFLGQNESFILNEYTVNVGTIFETKVEVWVDNEEHKFMNEGEIETFYVGGEDVNIKVDGIAYNDDVSLRRVLLTVGEPNPSGWGPIYYEDTNGDFQINQISKFYINLPENKGKSSIEYDQDRGTLNMGSINSGSESGDLIFSQEIHLSIATVREFLDGETTNQIFRDFGRIAESDEVGELVLWSRLGESGSFGQNDVDVQINEYTKVLSPETYLDNDKFRIVFTK